MSGNGSLYLHVGLAKTGTTFLQALLAENRPQLREAGFLYPFVRPEGMFHAAVEVRSDHARWGLDPGLIDGTWRALAAKAAEFEGAAIISHEILAGATAEEIARAAADLAGFDLHVVVTARDLARQVPAHWQEAVKNGETFSFAEYSREVLRERDAPNSHLWNEQDLLAVLDRWGAVTTPDKVHVVTCPPRGAARDELWHRFRDAVGLPDSVVDPAVAQRANESLGTSQVRLLRQVNEVLGGRVAQPWYALVVKRLFAQRVLPTTSSPRATAPDSMRTVLTELTQHWVDEITSRGYQVHGDLADLTPTEFGGPDPDDAALPESAELARLIAGLLEAEAAARAEAAEAVVRRGDAATAEPPGWSWLARRLKRHPR